MTAQQPLIATLLTLFLLVSPGAPSGIAQSTAGVTNSASSVSNGITVQLGIDGRYRPGRWAMLRIAGAEPGQTLRIESLDGDAVRFRRSFEVPKTATSDRSFQTYTPLGADGAPIELREFISDENVATPGPPLWRKRLVDGAVAPDRPWLIAFGNTLGFEKLGENQLLDLPGSIDVSLVEAVDELPDHWAGYDGVDQMVFSGDSVEILASLAENQGSALRDWILRGGRLLVSLGRAGPDLFAAAPWLSDLLVDESSPDIPEIVVVESELLETFVSARTQLEPFTVTRFAPRDATLLLSGKTRDRESVPLITRHAAGLGRITVLTAGLGDEPLADWKQREDLIARMIPELLPTKRRGGDRPSTNDVRYDELAGQLRLNLDQFEASGRVSFAIVAAIMLALIGLIGPVDYFLINRLLGRPLLGWISFPLTIIAFSAAIIVWNRDDAAVRVQQVSVLDIDPESQTGRGFSWAQIYTSQANRLDLGMRATGPIGGPVVVPNDDLISDLLVSPWGYPGAVFGGIVVTGEDIRLPAYELSLRNTERNSKNELASSLERVPLAPESSKGIVARWRFPALVDLSVDLRRRQGSDLLVGSLQNPFSVDLLDGYIVYRNLIYIFPRRITAGATLEKLENLPTKNFRWRLNRRQTEEDSSRSEPWNPGRDDDLDRLMEIVLFYSAAGGAKYVGLDNRVLEELDMTHLLAMDKAILVGRVQASEAQLLLDGEPAGDDLVEHHTYVRILLTVDNQ